MMETIYSILAVDYPIFPFRHMKTEVFGISCVRNVARDDDDGRWMLVLAPSFSLTPLSLGYRELEHPRNPRWLELLDQAYVIIGGLLPR